MGCMAAAELRVLGPIELFDGDDVVALAGKQMRLFAALVAARRPCGIDELVESLWDGSAPASARKLIQIYVSQLRKVLPEGVTIATQQGAYAAELGPGVLDAARFERLVVEMTEARLAPNSGLALSLADRALALWRGRAYGELGYEDFARAESERLEELRLTAHEERLAALLELGRHESALGEVLSFAAANTLRERAHELAMLALYRCGRQSDALDHFTAYRQALADELGLDP